VYAGAISISIHETAYFPVHYAQSIPLLRGKVVRRHPRCACPSHVLPGYKVQAPFPVQETKPNAESNHAQGGLLAPDSLDRHFGLGLLVEHKYPGHYDQTNLLPQGLIASLHQPVERHEG
ncbi:MAG: hypothetical protein AAF412_07725, partial [Pseudomonadota bacterium]